MEFLLWLFSLSRHKWITTSYYWFKKFTVNWHNNWSITLDRNPVCINYFLCFLLKGSYLDVDRSQRKDKDFSSTIWLSASQTIMDLKKMNTHKIGLIGIKKGNNSRYVLLFPHYIIAGKNPDSDSMEKPFYRWFWNRCHPNPAANRPWSK